MIGVDEDWKTYSDSRGGIMEEKHKSYGYEGGYDDWTADKVYKNMRIMQDGKQVAGVKETEDFGRSSGGRGYEGTDSEREEW